MALAREYTDNKQNRKFLSLLMFYLIGMPVEPLGPRGSGNPACFKNLWVEGEKIKE
jgi:hypothetical protein